MIKLPRIGFSGQLYPASCMGRCHIDQRNQEVRYLSNYPTLQLIVLEVIRAKLSFSNGKSAIEQCESEACKKNIKYKHKPRLTTQSQSKRTTRNVNGTS